MVGAGWEVEYVEGFRVSSWMLMIIMAYGVTPFYCSVKTGLLFSLYS
jgi:hypothetical protein